MPESVLFDFSTSPTAASDWQSVDDPVMGGVSESAFVATDHGAAFTGTVRLQHGSGFASVRAPDDRYDLSGAEGLALRLRGDGQRYWVTLYTDPGGPISYRRRIESPEQWSTVRVPFEDLTPYRRGTTAPDAPPFDPSQVRTFGFLIADEQEGPFHLDIAWVRTSGADPGG